ncbi:Sister chromatid cohesion protein 2 [Coemansia sp. BCRC 34301]|nr:Sister chromatid cohesion protein 2 [Coemansia sp. BCRC 34301]
MRPIDTQAPADTRRCLRYWPIGSSLTADTAIQTQYESITNLELALECDFERMSLSENKGLVSAVLSVVKDALCSNEIQAIRLKEHPTTSYADQAAPPTEIGALLVQLTQQHPSVTASPRESPQDALLSAGSGYSRLLAYVQRSAQTTGDMEPGSLVAKTDSALTVLGTAKGSQRKLSHHKRAMHCHSDDDTPAAKRQRPVLVHCESTSSDISGSVHPEPASEHVASFSSLTVSAAVDSTGPSGDIAARALSRNESEAVVQGAAAEQTPPPHIEMLEEFLTKLLHDEDRLSDSSDTKSEHFDQISLHGDILVLNKRAVGQLRELLLSCTPEQLSKYVSDDEMSRVIGMLAAVVEAADVVKLADMIKSGTLVERETGLSAAFCDQLDRALLLAYLGLDASGVIVDLAATGRASNSVCPGEMLHSAVTTFKDCLLGCVVPLLDMALGSMLAAAFSDSNGFLHNRFLAFLGTVLAAHDPITALVSGPTLAEQDIISLVFASISVTFCVSDLLGSGAGANLVESIRRAAQLLLRRVFEAHADQRLWILEEILASLIKLPTSKRTQSTYRIAGGKSVQFITVLLLKLLQGTAQSPEDLTAGFEGYRLPTKECCMLLLKHKKAVDAASSSTDFVIRYLIGRCMKRDSKASANEAEYRGLLETFIDNCIVLLGHPQWPAAELVIRVYSLHVLELLDDDKADIGLKSLALESTALVASHIATAQHDIEVLSKGRGVDALEPVLASTSLASITRFRTTTTTLLEYLQSKAVGGESTGAIPLYVSIWASMLVAALLKIRQEKANRGVEGASKDNDDISNGTDSEACTSGSDDDVSMDGDDDDGESSDSDYESRAAASSPTKKSALEAKKLASDKCRAIEECLKGYMSTVNRSTKAMLHSVPYASAVDAAKLAVSLLPLYKTFDALLARVTMALGAGQVTLRSKALRTLSQIASHRPSVLYQASVKFAINHRLQDSSPQVREAAIDLIGKHVAQNPELTSQYYDFISVRILDKGPSVRRRVIRILRDVYLLSCDQEQLVDIGIRLLQRTNDDERTIRELAFKTLYELWFSHEDHVLACEEEQQQQQQQQQPMEVSGNMFNTLSPEVQHQILKRVQVMTGVTEAARSRELGDLVAGLFEHITTVTTKAEAESAMFVIWCMVDALFEQLLRSEEPETNIDAGSSAVSVSRLSTTACLRFISTLSGIAPDAVGAHSEVLGTYLRMTEASEEDVLHHVLTIFSNTLLNIPHPSTQFLESLEGDLISLLSSSPQSILSVAVPCLCTLVHKITWSYGKLIRLFRSCALQLCHERRLVASGAAGAQSPKNLMRFIILAGLTCCHFDFDEHRAMHKDHFKGLDEMIKTTVPAFMNDVLLFFASSHPLLPVQLAAMQMLGQLYIKHPPLALESRARAVMDKAFAGGNNGHKLQALRNFHDFLRADAKRYAARARASKDQVREVDAKALVGDTGEMSEAGVGASLMQTYLDRVIDATFVSNAAPLRATGFEVISLVLEQGLAHPLKCVPALIALSTSSDPHIRSKALKLHQDLNFKYASFIHSRDIEGVHKAYEYQAQLHGRVEDVVGYDPCSEAREAAGRPVAFLQPLYSLLRTRRARRNDFLSLLVKIGDVDADSGAGASYSEGWRSDVPFVRFVAENIAGLDFKYLDEVLHVNYQISAIIAGTGSNLLHQFDAESQAKDVHRAAAADTPSGAAHGDRRATEASVCIGILFVLREFLKAHYGIAESKCAGYNPNDPTNARDKPVVWHGQNDQGRIDWSAWPFAVKCMESTADYSDQRARFRHLMAGSLAVVEDGAGAAGENRSFEDHANGSGGSFVDDMALNADELAYLTEQLIDD